MENGHKRSAKSWKTHIKSSWKVTENHFQCSICTLYIFWYSALVCADSLFGRILSGSL